MGYGKDVQAELRVPGRALREKIPDVYAAYGAMHQAVMVNGALDARTKELIALSIAVVKRCDGCIAAHARGAAKQGATAEQVAEALGVAIMLDGGPGTVYGPRALAAFEEFAAPPAP